MRTDLTRMTPRLRGRAGQKQRNRRMLAAGYRCTRCPELATVIDHIVPLALGGTDDDSNTRALCSTCHMHATAEQFGKRVKPSIGLDGWPQP